MEFDTIGNGLIVADAYYGIWSLDLDTGKKTQLVSPTEELDGKVETSLFFSIYHRLGLNPFCILFHVDSSSSKNIQLGCCFEIR